MFNGKKFKKFLMLSLIMVMGIVPKCVDAADYNTAVEADREKILSILPDTTFDNENVPSVGVEVSLKKGDTIYFENTNKWNNVLIYIFDAETGGAGWLYDWPGVAMEKTGETVNGNDIYKYTFQSDVTSFNKLIFVGYDDNGNIKQTKDLSYVGNGLYFSINTDAGENSKYDGTWYIYDKSRVSNYAELLASVEKYKDLLTVESYQKVMDDMTKINEMVNNLRVPSNFYTHSTKNLYISDYYELVYEITTEVNSLEVDTEKLETLLKEAESTDTTGWTEDEVSALNTAISEYKDLLTQLKADPTLIYVSPATSDVDVTVQFENAVKTMEKLKLSKSNLKTASSVEVCDTNNRLNDVDNPNTVDNIIFSVVLLVASVLGMAASVMLYRKRIKTN